MSFYVGLTSPLLAATNIRLMVRAVDEREDAACFIMPFLSWLFFITIFLVAFISLLYK